MNLSTKLYIAKLPHIPESYLHRCIIEYFSQIGQIKNLILFKHPGGRLKGDCFLEYFVHTHAIKAISTLNGSRFLGRNITVNYFRRKNQSADNINQQQANFHNNCNDTDNDDDDDYDDSSEEETYMVRAQMNQLFSLLNTASLSSLNSCGTVNLNNKTNTNTTSLISTEDKIEAMMKKCKSIDESQTKSLIKAKLSSFANETSFLVLNENYTIKLICPLTQMKLKVPARGDNCKHIECFDLKSFISLYHNSISWSCPICKNILSIQTLKIDEFMKRVVNETSGFNEISIDANGHWKKIEVTFNVNKTSKASNLNETIVIGDSDDDDGDCVIEKEKEKNKTEKTITSLQNQVKNLKLHLKTISDKVNQNDMAANSNEKILAAIVRRSQRLSVMSHQNEAINPINVTNIINQSVCEISESVFNENLNKIKCDLCDKWFHAKGIKRHITVAHKVASNI